MITNFDETIHKDLVLVYKPYRVTMTACPLDTMAKADW